MLPLGRLFDLAAVATAPAVFLGVAAICAANRPGLGALRAAWLVAADGAAESARRLRA